VVYRGKQNLLGVRIDAIDYAATVSRVVAAAYAGKRCTVAALAVHGVMAGASDPVHRYRLNHLDLAVPDGQPVRWAINILHGTGLRDRVYGPKLMFLLCKEAAALKIPVFFYGSRRPVVQKLADRMAEICAGLEVAGYHASEFRKLTVVERQNLITRITDSGAKILFVGLGCPRQEIFVYEMGKHLNLPILAVGAAFDYYSGFLSEPPEYMQKLGLQWVYRLAQEPRRLWKRYLILNSSFLVKFALQVLRVKISDPAEATRPLKDMLYG
jgi:N-acetylglucosaminyldiphosphoundecaprenol N-acetyl-beta-D-mannosaminyltransferase